MILKIFKNLARRAAFDKVLRDNAFEIAKKIQNMIGIKEGFPCFGKKLKGSGMKSKVAATPKKMS